MAKKKSSRKKAATKKVAKAAPPKQKKAAAKKKPVASKQSAKKAASTSVRIGPAKGRPMLQWVGKKPLTQVTAFPAQHVETFDPSGVTTASNPGGQLFHGDNKEVLASLLANGYRGKVDLIYIDPPFDSGVDYVRKVTLRGKSASATTRIDADEYSLGEQIQYSDIWANDSYLQFMFERTILLKELLSATGSLYIHCDYRKSHLLRLVCDEVFGGSNFVSEIIWQSSDAQSSANRFGPIHNTLFYYSKSEKRTWNNIRTPLPKATADSWYTHEEVATETFRNALGEVIEKGTVRRFNASDLTARKRGGDTEYEWNGVKPSPGRYWAYSRENMQEFEDNGKIHYTGSGRPYLKRYLDEVEGISPQDVWTDIAMLRGISNQASTEYPTEKPEPLLERLTRISSNAGDLVLDCFVGSGTTAAVAQKLGRRWIGCDINKGAIQTTSRRLQSIIRQQLAERDEARRSPKLIADDNDDVPTPAQWHFSIHRVNDYDLQIQHNEAVALACEHIGVTRKKSDPYFDGTQGKRLVKIIPFNHPLSPTDLEQLRDELQARSEEERDILLVCLGKEFAADTWLAEWNRLRRKGDVPNKIQVIELRTDPKYGKFIAHKPASARVRIKRKADRIHVDVQDFMSPSILERLEQQNGLLTPQIEDWRSMIDCLMIDTAWDGTVFNICLSDIPAKKADLISAAYDLHAPKGETTVAVKLIDMLGEEVVVSSQV